MESLRPRPAARGALRAAPPPPPSVRGARRREVCAAAAPGVRAARPRRGALDTPDEYEQMFESAPTVERSASRARRASRSGAVAPRADDDGGTHVLLGQRPVVCAARGRKGAVDASGARRRRRRRADDADDAAGRAQPRDRRSDPADRFRHRQRADRADRRAEAGDVGAARQDANLYERQVPAEFRPVGLRFDPRRPPRRRHARRERRRSLLQQAGVPAHHQDGGRQWDRPAVGGEGGAALDARCVGGDPHARPRRRAPALSSSPHRTTRAGSTKILGSVERLERRAGARGATTSIFEKTKRSNTSRSRRSCPTSTSRRWASRSGRPTTAAR